MNIVELENGIINLDTVEWIGSSYGDMSCGGPRTPTFDIRFISGEVRQITAKSFTELEEVRNKIIEKFRGII